MARISWVAALLCVIITSTIISGVSAGLDSVLQETLDVLATRYAESSVTTNVWLQANPPPTPGSIVVSYYNGSDTGGDSVGVNAVTYSSIPSKFVAVPSAPWSPNTNLLRPSPPALHLQPLSPWTRPQSSFSSCPVGATPGMAKAPLDGNSDASSFLKSAQSSSSLLYLPLQAGKTWSTLTISTSMTIDKPLIAPCGVQIYVPSGRTLTISARPRAVCSRPFSRALFSGAGTIRFTGNAGAEVLPAWFGSDGSASINAALKACAAGTSCAVVLTRPTSLGSTVSVPAEAGIFSTAAATLVGTSSITGVTLQPGTRSTSRPVILSSMRGSAQAIRVAPGVKNLRLQAGTLQAGTTGILLDASYGAAHESNDLFAVACEGLLRCVWAAGGSDAGSLGSSLARVNLVTTIARSGLEITGSRAPACNQCGAIFQAVDPTPANPGFVAVRSTSATPLVNGVFGAQTWMGGFAASGSGIPSGQFVTGKFSTLRATLGLAAVGLALPTKSLSLQGTTNRPTLPYIDSAGAVTPLYTSASAASANPVFTATTAYFSVNTGTGWESGGTRAWWLATPYATYSPGFSILPFLADNPGIVLSSIRVVSGNLLRITLRNASPTTVRENYVHRFGLQFAA